MLKKYSANRRNSRAVTVIEMVVGLIVVIPIVLLLIDLILLTMAVQINDSAAREAVRLAAAGDPTLAVSRAQRVVDRINSSTTGYVSNVTLLSVTFNPVNLIATQASMVPYGGVVQGSVKVNTQVDVSPIMLGFMSTSPLKFQSSQSCPVNYNIPNTAGGQPVPP